MEFPDNAVTNVHKIGRVNNLDWTFYSLVDSIVSDPHEHLQICEHALRTIGNHVLSDPSRRGLWLFSLLELEAQTESELIEMGQTTQSILESNFKKVSSGTLKASRFSEDSPHPAFPVLSDNSAAMNQTTGNQRRNITPSSFREPSPSSKGLGLKGYRALDTISDSEKSEPANDTFILMKMQKAVSMSCIARLTKTTRWLPLGDTSCVRNAKPHALIHQVNEDWSAFTPSDIMSMAVVVEWMPSADMLVTSSCHVLPGVRRLSEMIVDQHQDSELSQPYKVLLSPSALTVLYVGLVDNPDEIEENAAEAFPGQRFASMKPLNLTLAEKKRSTVRRLAQRGIKLSSEEKWVRLRYENPAVHNDLKQDHVTGSFVTFLWPASLCFYFVQASLYETKWSQPLNFGQGIRIDPLLYAEAWLKTKADRQEAVEIKRKQNEAEVQKSKDAQNQRSREPFTDLIPRPTQLGSTQDVTSIYPTPPDGFPSNNLVSLTQRPTPVNYGDTIEKGHLDDINADPHLMGSPIATNLAPVISSTTYDQLEDDLYAEVDNDLFAANDLTEADLDFFDQPRAEKNVVLPANPDAHFQNAFNDRSEGLGLHFSANVLKKAVPEVAVEQVTAKAKIESRQKIFDRGEDSRIDNLPRDPSREKNALPGNLNRNLEHYLPAHIQVDTELSLRYPRHFDHDANVQRKLSFQSIPFKENLDEFDEKYVRGRFGYPQEDAPDSSRIQIMSDSRNSRIPRVGLFPSLDQGSDTTEDESTSDVSEPVDNDLSQEDIDDEVRLLSTLKRKRTPEQANADSVSTPQCLSIAGATLFTQNLSDAPLCMFSQDLNGELAGSSSAFLDSFKPETPKYHGHDRDFMQTAQLIVEQLSLGTNSLSEVAQSLENPYCHPSRGEPKIIEDPLRMLMLQEYPRSEQLNLHQLTIIGRETKELTEGIMRDNVLSRSSQKENMLISKSPSSPNPLIDTFSLSVPYARITRNQKSIDILGSALHFWEELGLEPAHGPKNILALYLYPAIGTIRERLKLFATMVAGSYQSCKLGTHESITSLTEYSHGLVPVPSVEGTVAEKATHLKSFCEKLGKDLASLHIPKGNIVIYIINLFESPNFLPHLCAAYLILSRSYVALTEANKMDRPNDIVLQIVPGELVASADALTLPSPEAYRRLAMEVYNRCGPDTQLGNRYGLRFFCVPSIQLARPIPKSIPLALSPEPSVDFLHADMFFHLAYSWYPGQQWLTASWTDNQGELQWNAPYCVGVPGEKEPWPVILAILTEIWETTLELFSHPGSPWRLFIAKDGPMREEELEVWLSLSAQASHKFIVATILTVEANSLLCFPSQNFSAVFPLTFSSTYKSTASTPADHTTSPEQFGIVSTPGGVPNPLTPASGVVESDHDTKLIDITEESWGVILPHPFPSRVTPSCYCRSVAGAYLLKRAGARDEDGVLPLAVNVVHMPMTKDGVLRELLGMYRDLAALARLRGTIHGLHGIMPWHIATARNTNEGMNEMMSWDWG